MTGVTVNGRVVTHSFFNSLLGRVLPLLFGVASLPILVRMLGTERFGILSLVWVILGHFGMLDLGMGRAATRFVAAALGRGDSQRVVRVLWTCCVVQALLGVVGAMGLYFLAPVLVNVVLNVPADLARECEACFVLIGFSLPLVLIESSLRGALKAHQRFDLVNWVKVPASCLSILIPMGGALAGWGLPMIVFCLVLSRAVALAAYFLLLKRLVPLLSLRPRFDRELLKPITAFSGWVSVSNFCGPLLGYTERFLIGSVLSLGALTFYVVPMDALSRLLVLPASLASALFPALSSINSKSTSDLRPLLIKPTKLLVAMGVPVVVLGWIVCPDILAMFFGKEFASASTAVTRILLCVVFLNALAFVPFSLVQGLGRPEWKARLDLIELPIFLCFGYLLVSEYGLIGAAMAKLLITVIDFCALTVMSSRLTTIPLTALARRTLLPGLVPFSFLFAASSLVEAAHFPIVSKLLLCSFLALLYFALACKFTMNGSEREFVRHLLARLVQRFKPSQIAV